MKIDKRIILLGSVAVATGITLVTSVFAWIRPLERIQFENASGRTDNTAYFAGGTGKDDDPYIISDPIHLYNLAWLQYLGKFNNDAPLKKYYFSVVNDLDMSGYVLPPIGTEQYPFFSSFEGNGHSISNLTVSNTIGSNQYEINKTPVGVTTIQNCDIVGFFGVVGNYKTHTSSSITPEVKNFYLNGIDVNANTTHALAGIGVGYVSGEVSKVGVCNSELYFNNSSVTKLDSQITDNLSDYTLVGYCVPQYQNTTSVVDTKVYTPSFSHKSFNYEGPEGTENASGGSIPMDKIFNRVKDIGQNYSPRVNNYQYLRTDIEQLDGTITHAYSTTNYTRLYNANNVSSGKTYNQQWGSFVFNSLNANNTFNDQYMFLSGGQSTNLAHVELTQTINGFTISYGGNYLCANAAYNGFTSTTNVNEATIWKTTTTNQTTGASILTTGSTRFYVVNPSNNQQYYIGLNNNYGLVLATTSTYELTYNSGNTLYYRGGNIFNRRYYYVTYNNGWTISSNETALSFTESRGDVEVVLDDGAGLVDYNTKNVTYFPLSVINADGGDYSPSSNNSGYIISGAGDRTTSQTYPVRTGDIRISYYSNTSSFFTSAALQQSWSNGAFTNVYTINSSNNEQSHAITTAEEASFQKYAKTKASMAATLASSDNVYGLHFMNTSIDEDNIVTADWVSINEQVHTNYQLPASCIDFNLKEQGWVNFFGGTYYTDTGNNDSFFSLHKIERGENLSISEIKEIKEIFWDNNEEHEVIYQFTDDTYSIAHTVSRGVPTDTIIAGSTTTSKPTSFVSVFKTSWIKRNTLTMRAAYYFEFPMNVGEFALGSVDGATGAYLMYLDIAANAQKIVETTISEKWTYETRTYVTPFGIALVSSTSDEINNYEGIIAFAIKSYVDKVGVNYTKTESSDEATFICESMNNVECVYKTTSTTLKNSSGTEITDITYKTLAQEEHVRVSFYDYNVTTGNTVVTTNLDGVITIKKYDSDGNELEFIAGEENFYRELDKHQEGVATNVVLFNFKYQYISSTQVTVTCTIDLDTSYMEGSEVDLIYVLSGYTFTFTCNYENGDVPSLYATIIKVEGGYVLTINDNEGVEVAKTYIVVPNE